MKKHLCSVLLGATALLAPSNVSASLLIAAFNDFDAATNTEAADYVAGGFSGVVIDGAGQPSVDTGGSNDLTFGNTTFSEHAAGGSDGYLRTIDVSDPVVQVTNHTGGAYSLESLLFDAASQNAGNSMVVTYRLGTTGSWLSLFTATNLPVSGAANVAANYGDYLVNLLSLGITLLNGNTIQFKFDGAPNGRIDNIALTGLSAIPEPASLLALGCLIGSGLLMRQRRRAAV